MDGGKIWSLLLEMLISRSLLDIKLEMSSKPWVYKPGVQERNLGWKYPFVCDCIEICTSGHNEITEEMNKNTEENQELRHLRIKRLRGSSK